MVLQINTTINLPTHPPTLLREIQDRIGGTLVRPSAALIWSGVITAIMTGVPAFMAIYAAFADLLADPTKGIDLSGEQSITELSGLMSGAILNVFLSVAFFLLVALPFRMELDSSDCARFETSPLSDLISLRHIFALGIFRSFRLCLFCLGLFRS